MPYVAALFVGLGPRMPSVLFDSGWMNRFWVVFVLLGLSFSLAACAPSVRLDGVSSMRAVPSTGQAVAQAARSQESPSVVTPAKDWRCNEVSELVESPQARRMARDVPPVIAAATPAVPPADALSIVYFDFDKSEIRQEFTPILEAHARHLLADSRRQVVLEGHCDERGSSEYNIALGQRRSEAVRRALSQLGVKDSQMETISFGEEKPVIVAQDEAEHAQNRRVEFRYR